MSQKPLNKALHRCHVKITIVAVNPRKISRKAVLLSDMVLHIKY